MNTQKNKKTVWRIVLAVCIALFLAAGILLLLHLLPPGNGDVVSVPGISDAPTSSAPIVELPENPINFAALQERNPDIHAWIKVPGTVIDYAILQSGNNVPENFYLDHDEDGNYRFAGSIYIQQINRPDFGHPNTVIYGHNMRNGSMFAALHKFKKKDFFDEHQYIYIYTPGHILTYQIYTAFVYDDRHILNSFDFSDREQYAAFLEQSLNPVSFTKQVREGITVTPDDRIITLSTCTARDTERLLVEGVLIHDQLTK